MTCPECGAAGLRVIYAGLPMALCSACEVVWGLLGWWPVLLDKVGLLPFNGTFFAFSGWYLPALAAWLLGRVR